MDEHDRRIITAQNQYEIAMRTPRGKPKIYFTPYPKETEFEIKGIFITHADGYEHNLNEPCAKGICKIGKDLKLTNGENVEFAYDAATARKEAKMDEKTRKELEAILSEFNDVKVRVDKALIDLIAIEDKIVKILDGPTAQSLATSALFDYSKLAEIDEHFLGRKPQYAERQKQANEAQAVSDILEQGATALQKSWVDAIDKQNLTEDAEEPSDQQPKPKKRGMEFL